MMPEYEDRLRITGYLLNVNSYRAHGKLSIAFPAVLYL